MYRLVALILSVLPVPVMAADNAVGQGLTRMVLGMVIVLICIGVLAWLARKVLPGHAGAQTGIIRQVGGLSLSPRERVVVLEVGGRWLVVGLNGQQMTALGELPAYAATTDVVVTRPEDARPDPTVDASAPFATRLQQAMQHTLRQSVKSFNNKA